MVEVWSNDHFSDLFFKEYFDGSSQTTLSHYEAVIFWTYRNEILIYTVIYNAHTISNMNETEIN